MGAGMTGENAMTSIQGEIQETDQEMTGFQTRNPPHRPVTVRERPMSLAWITEDLLQYTQEVWSKAYGVPVTEDEAIEILRNVKRLAEILRTPRERKGGKRK